MERMSPDVLVMCMCVCYVLYLPVCESYESVLSVFALAAAMTRVRYLNMAKVKFLSGGVMPDS